MTITVPGSYRLTGSLTVSDPNIGAIEVTADGVSIDLNGFEVAGPVTCTGEGSSVSCSAGIGSGISATNQRRISVRNGRVRGFGSSGVEMDELGLIESLIAESNGGNGILTSDASILIDVTTYRNGQRGITATGGGSLVHDATLYANAGRGLLMGGGSLVSECAVYTNGGNGVEVDGCGASIQRSALRANGGAGLDLASATSSYRENTISGNTGGTVTGAAVDLGANACNGVAACP